MLYPNEFVLLRSFEDQRKLPLQEDEAYYIIPYAWYHQWSKYTIYREEERQSSTLPFLPFSTGINFSSTPLSTSTSLQQVEHPGPIDASALANPENPKLIRLGLIETDYIALPRDMYRKLRDIYSLQDNSPEFQRIVITKGGDGKIGGEKIIDMYPVDVYVQCIKYKPVPISDPSLQQQESGSDNITSSTTSNVTGSSIVYETLPETYNFLCSRYFSAYETLEHIIKNRLQSWSLQGNSIGSMMDMCRLKIPSIQIIPSSATVSSSSSSSSSFTSVSSILSSFNDSLNNNPAVITSAPSSATTLSSVSSALNPSESIDSTVIGNPNSYSLFAGKTVDEIVRDRHTLRLALEVQDNNTHQWPLGDLSCSALQSEYAQSFQDRTEWYRSLRNNDYIDVLDEASTEWRLALVSDVNEAESTVKVCFVEGSEKREGTVPLTEERVQPAHTHSPRWRGILHYGSEIAYFVKDLQQWYPAFVSHLYHTEEPTVIDLIYRERPLSTWNIVEGISIEDYHAIGPVENICSKVMVEPGTGIRKPPSNFKSPNRLSSVPAIHKSVRMDPTRILYHEEEDPPAASNSTLWESPNDTGYFTRRQGSRSNQSLANLQTGETEEECAHRFLEHYNQPSYYSLYRFSQPLSSLTSLDPRYIPGYCGLENLGNTCFMNSMLQCLSNTGLLTEFFTSERYLASINRTNPLGSKGALAHSYGALMRAMWSGKHSHVSPSPLKRYVAERAPQFIGFQQHDSQEFMAFLIDGLLEDLCRITKKPTTTTVEGTGRPETEIANEAWNNYINRNDSIITDIFAGQYRSYLECIKCHKASVTFDPFISVSVPLPSRRIQSIYAYYYTAKNDYPLEIVYRYLEGEKDTYNDLIEFIIDSLYYDPSSTDQQERLQKYFPHLKFPKDQEYCAALAQEPRPFADDMFVYRYIKLQKRPRLVTLPSLAKIDPKESYCVYHIPFAYGTPKITLKDTNTLSSSSLTLTLTLTTTSSSLSSSSLLLSNAAGPTEPPAKQLRLDTNNHSTIGTPEEIIPLSSTSGSSHFSPGSPPSGIIPSSSSYLTDSITQNKRPRDEGSRNLMVSTNNLTLTVGSSLSSDDTVMNRTTSSPKSMVIVWVRYVNYSGIRYKPAAEAVVINRHYYMGEEVPNLTNKQFIEVLLDKLKPFLRDKNSFSYEKIASTCTIGYFERGPNVSDAYLDEKIQVEIHPNDEELIVPANNKVQFSFDFSSEDVYNNEINRQIIDQFYQTITSLSEFNPRPSEDITLESCFQRFSVREQLGEHDMWYCPNCKEHIRALKQMALWKLPDVLIVHLKRFQASPGSIHRNKISSLVDYPITGLDLANFVQCPQDKSTVYDLFAVSEHSGSLYGGHYTAVARNYRNGQWYHFNDSSVCDANMNGLVNSSAYVLFYVRRETTELPNLSSTMEPSPSNRTNLSHGGSETMPKNTLGIDL